MGPARHPSTMRIAAWAAASSSTLFSLSSFQEEEEEGGVRQDRVYNESMFGGLTGGGGKRKKTPPPSTSPNSKLVPISCADGTQVIPYQTPTRAHQLHSLQSTTTTSTSKPFDILIIGGGAVGAGIALDASIRGLHVALVERDDFSAGTSGRSTKLIHGGIRYLENAFKKLDWGEYELVKEALEERKHMLEAAPYMNKPLPIMIPIYQNRWYDWMRVPYYLAGAWVYDFVAGSSSGVPNSHFIGRAEAMYQFPMLRPDHLLGAIVYYDGQMNDTRMCLHLALTATQKGATVVSRVQVVDLIHDKETGRVCGAVVKNVCKDGDGEEFVVRAKAVVNATGPFVDGIRRLDYEALVKRKQQLDKDDQDGNDKSKHGDKNKNSKEMEEFKPMITGAAGVHVVLPDHYSPTKMGLIVPKTKDGRVLFFLPWEGGTIAGTTDAASELTMTPRPSDRDIGFILEESNNYLRQDKSVSTHQVRAAWSGIRPLVRDPSKSDTQSISRSHVVDVAPTSKLVTVAGGKWTTYRRMAEDAVDRILEEMPEVAEGRALDRVCKTKGKGILGADRAGIVTSGKFDRIVVTLREEYGLPKDVAYHLVHNYGTRALQIAEITNETSSVYDARFVSSTGEARRICTKYPYITAEIKFAVEQEYALTAVDVLARRTRLAHIDSEAARNATEKVVELMGGLLGWGKERRKREVEECLEWLDTMNMEDKAGRGSGSE